MMGILVDLIPDPQHCQNARLFICSNTMGGLAALHRSSHTFFHFKSTGAGALYNELAGGGEQKGSLPFLFLFCSCRAHRHPLQNW
jgi:hypothetical protein